MRYEHAFEVAGRPAEVIEKFADLPSLAEHLPGASVGPANADGSHPGTLVVSFGPKRIAFKGTVINRVDRAGLCGVLSGTASADVRGTRMAVTMNYTLAESEERPGGTKVRLDSEAQLTGVLAEFAKTGGVIVANAVLAEFAKSFSAQFVPAPAGAAPPPAARAEALSAASLGGHVVRSIAASIAGAFANAWRALFPKQG